MKKKGGQLDLPSERDLVASLALLVMCLAQYFAGSSRSKLISWLDVQAEQMKAEGFEDVHLSHIRGVADGLRMGELGPFFEILRPSKQGSRRPAKRGKGSKLR